MTLFSFLRYLRHGPLRFASPIWQLLGRIYRAVVTRTGVQFTVSHLIGPYGPFHMQPKFAFSNFNDWGKKHNRGFNACIDTSRGKSCVLDIGAHIGLVTMPLSNVVSPIGQVIAFEPSAANIKTLKQHLTLNNITNVKVVDCIVGDTIANNVAFYESSEVSGMNTCAPIKSGTVYQRHTRPQTTIDRFCHEHNLVPEVIKIDVEGFELSVLEGSLSILRNAKPTIFLSVHPKHLLALGRTTQELQLFLDTVGYKLVDVTGNHVRDLQLDEYIVKPGSP